MNSKETIKEFFFNYPSKHWHFEQLMKESKLSRAQTNEWLKKLKKQGLIKRIKPKGKMPYYVARHDNPHYRNTKQVYAFTTLYKSGLLDYLCSLENVKTIILFGSFVRGDWYKDSDIDIFIYGESDLSLGKYLSKLKREIQVFSGKDEKDLKKFGAPLLKNIIKGVTLKGDIPQEVIKHAIV